jgi:hypothetical protein
MLTRAGVKRSVDLLELGLALLFWHLFQRIQNQVCHISGSFLLVNAFLFRRHS